LWQRLAVRSKGLVPEAALPAVLSARSLTGTDPVLGTPGLARVLVVAAHPDDETVCSGGTLRLLADAGAAITVVYATSGEATAGASGEGDVVGARRRDEARRACSVLGAGQPTFLGYPDGEVTEWVAELGAELGPWLDAVRPHGVFVPWLGDGHPDHRAVSHALALADPTGMGMVEVWASEAWTPLTPNRLVDITRVAESKRGALDEHDTASAAFDLHAVMGLARYRSIHGLLGRGYAEAFTVTDLANHRSLAASA
jgi:LmbE family N-acetylglucosaminyl deacetylase